MKDWSFRWAQYQPNKIALKQFETGETLTYGELNLLANRISHILTKKWGLKKGDRLAFLSYFNLESCVLFAVAQKTGIILVPLNYRLSAGELDYIIQNADPSLVLYEKVWEPLLTPAPSFSKIAHSVNLRDWEDLFSPQSEHMYDKVPFESAEIDENDPIFILYTSGTTGYPKGALYTHKMLFWNSVNTALRLSLTEDDRTLNFMPPFHTGGWNVLLTPLWHRGGFSCLMKRFDPVHALKALDEEAISICMGVPTMLQMMSETDYFREAALRHLRYFVVGGEAMPIPQIERWQKKNIPIRQGYGMTEVGPNLFSLHQKDAIRKKGSIGFPNFYVETKVLGMEGKEATSNEAGELLLKGPMVTPGYWRNEKASQAAFNDGWFSTGDLVKVDEEGYFYVIDRIKNMFISGGENVYPVEVERVLIQHPHIREVAVIGIPDDTWGEVGRAFIALEHRTNLDLDQLKKYCEGKLAKYKIPKKITFLKELPKNPTGKIHRKSLKEDLQ